MKKIHISTDRILLILIIVLLWTNTLIKACESEHHPHPEPTIASSIYFDKIETTTSLNAT